MQTSQSQQTAKPSQRWQRGDPEAGWRATSNSRKGRGGALLNSEVGGADKVKKRILFNIWENNVGCLPTFLNTMMTP